jgi:hypothetical protein
MVSSHPLSTGCQQHGESSMNGPHVVRAGVMMDDAHSDRTACTRQPPCRPCPAKMSLSRFTSPEDYLRCGCLFIRYLSDHGRHVCLPCIPCILCILRFGCACVRVALVRVHGGSPVNRWLPCMPSTRYFLAYRWTSIHRTWRPVLQRMCATEDGTYRCRHAGAERTPHDHQYATRW